MRFVEGRALRSGQPARLARKLAVNAYIPYGQPSQAPPAPAPPPATELVAPRSTSSSLPAFPSLTAPSISADVIAERATASHWGSRVVEESLAAATAALQASTPAGVVELADALQELQATLGDNLTKLTELGESTPSGGSGIEQSLAAVAAQLQAVAAKAQAAATSLGGLGQAAPAAGSPQAPGPLASASLAQVARMQYAGYSLQTLAAVTGAVSALVALSVPRQNDDDQLGGSGGGGGRGVSGGVAAPGDVLPTSWDPVAVEGYYSQRPTLVARRMLEVAGEAVSYGVALLTDMATGSVERNMAERADQAMRSIERLGPAYVKVAQALSTRVDLLPTPYLIAIQRLQDRVPPFPDAVAYACIERSFGRPLGEVFSSLSNSAVAAASLGQVYKGTLRSSGQEVAIKVRRPGVLDSVTLDLFLMRQVAIKLREVPEVRSDWVGIIDNWAERFLDEMNYQLEAANTAKFQTDLADLPGIVIPDVVQEGTSNDVIVLSWIEGERLTDSKAADVRELCDTLLSAYLIQLLDTGFLHADPHPGNLLRTPDGRVAILDHGLISEIPREYCLALLEYIAHLSVGDWDSLVDDLVALGFVDSVDDKEKLVGPLGAILTQLSAGGGAKSVNIQVVMDEIDRMTQMYDFRVPPYFALILRTFSVIEGIALQSDPKYSIVRECFPYLARRLLTDDSPRARQALKELLFAGGDQLDLERFEQMFQGVQNFTVDGLADPSSSGAPAPAAAAAGGSQLAPVPAAQPNKPLIDSTVKEVLAAVFSAKPTYVQELVVQQAVGTVDAAGRQLAASLLRPALGNLAAAQSAMEQGVALPGVPTGAALPPGLSVLSRLPALVELSPADQQQLRTAQGISALLLQQQQQAGGAPQLTPQEAAAVVRQLAEELQPMLPQLLPGVAATGQMFVRELGKRAGDRLAAVVADGQGPQDPSYRAPMDL